MLKALVGLLCWAWFVLQGISIVSIAYEHRQRTAELQAISQQVAKAEEIHAVWQAELEYLNSLFVLEQKADELNMFPPRQESKSH